MKTAYEDMQRMLPEAGALIAPRGCAFNLPHRGVGRQDML